MIDISLSANSNTTRLNSCSGRRAHGRKREEAQAGLYNKYRPDSGSKLRTDRTAETGKMKVTEAKEARRRESSAKENIAREKTGMRHEVKEQTETKNTKEKTVSLDTVLKLNERHQASHGKDNIK